MSRLIDADEAKKLINGLDSSFAKYVDDIPTAYDIDKVIEELENLDVETQSCQNCKYVKECDDMQEKYNPSEKVDLCAMLTRIKAIEIVKKGGK